MFPMPQFENKPLISIVIVTFNSKDLVDRCLRNLYGKEGIEIVIVDNNSADGSAAYIERVWPKVGVVRSSDNLGFAGGCNLGFRYCKSDVIALVNPDAFLDDISQLLQLRDILHSSDSIVMVGPQLVNEDGSHQIGDAGWRDGFVALVGHFLFFHRLLSFWPSGYILNPKVLRKALVDVDWVCGACLVFKRSILSIVGELDNSIFMYGEDMEWGVRVRQGGYRVVYVPAVKVLHLQGSVKYRGQQIIVSTNWLAQHAKLYSNQGRISFYLFKFITGVGFFARLLIALALHFIDRTWQSRNQVDKNCRYLGFIMRLRRADLE